MELQHWQPIVCALLCILVNHSSGDNGIPSSPCQNMFQYQREGNEWFGLVQVQSSLSRQTMKLELFLSLLGQLPSVIISFISITLIPGSHEFYLRLYFHEARKLINSFI